jgi:hypothetical protein
MSEPLSNLRGVRVLMCTADGKKLRRGDDAIDLIADAMYRGAGLIVVPAARFEADFFRLDTRIAGEIIQKFVTYKLRLAIVGDISRHLAESSALRAFVDESNRGLQVWFVPSLDELDQRLERALRRGIGGWQSGWGRHAHQAPGDARQPPDGARQTNDDASLQQAPDGATFR